MADRRKMPKRPAEYFYVRGTRATEWKNCQATRINSIPFWITPTTVFPEAAEAEQRHCVQK